MPHPTRQIAAPLSAALALSVLLAPPAARSQTAPEPGTQPGPAEPALRQNAVPAETGTTPGTGEQGSVFDRDKLLGTIGGLRPALDGYGVNLGLTEADEVLGNVTGGRHTGAVFEGLTTATLDVDTEKLVGLPGGTLHASGFQIHGRGLTANDLDNLSVASSLEASRSTRLFELWYQQTLFGGKADVKIGQQSADLEFMTTTYGGLFINSSFGFPTSFATDLPAGGPAYPLGALAVRLRVKPVDPWTALLAVYNATPSKPGDGDPQGRRNPSGTDFRLGDGVLVFGELQYALNAADDAPGLPGTYKLGFWYNSDRFANQFDLATGAPLPRNPRGDWALYAVIDQLVWKQPGSKDGGVGVFARVSGSPADRNLVDLFVDAGVTYKGVFGRDADTIGLGAAWAHISRTAQSGDQALAATLPSYPIRSAEWLVELTYQAQLVPAIQLQPFLQAIINPGGNLPNPDHPTKRLGNAALLGLRSTITF